MKPLLFISLISLGLLSACTPEPEPIDYGSDMCDYCKMTIVDAQHGAELVTNKGKITKFDAIECMVNRVLDQPEQEYAYELVNDYQSPGELIPAQMSSFLISEAIPSPMGAYLSALKSEAAAKALQAEKGGAVFSWKELPAALQKRGVIR